MVRKLVVMREDGSSPVLGEVSAADEAQLQELMKSKPDLLPVDEFGMTGPLLILGRETPLPSGAVDLVALAKSGEILLIEFKTGPQNTDFRRVLAQLLDYGSDLWRMTYDEFEAAVARRYFESNSCTDPAARGKSTVEEAARAIWRDLSGDEVASMKERVARQLASGSFHYLVVAQRFTSPVERTLEYLNASMPGPRFYGLELIRFSADGLSAFECRTVLRPASSKPTESGDDTDEARFLQAAEGDDYRDALRELLEVFRGLGLRFGWGKTGTSIRISTPDRREPLTIAWLFPPGGIGWMGLSHITLGFDSSSSSQTPSVQPALDTYLKAAAELPGAEAVKSKTLRAYHLGPQTVVHSRPQITEVVARLAEQVGAIG